MTFTKEQRKAQIQEIIKGEPVATGTKLIYQGETREFNVYKIPLDLLIYNVDNGRIATVVKSYIREHGALEADDSAGAKKIADFLYESNIDRNKTTLKDLADHGQQEPGIITMDGLIVDGNRRASLLNRIRTSATNEFSQSQKDRSAYFFTRVLPEDATQKEVLRLETTYQMSTDGKVDYNPLEKYLHAKDMKDHGFTEKEIAEYMNFKSESEVKKVLKVQELMDEYLENYGYEGIYTQLPHDCEDKLLKLESTISRIHSGGYSWIPQDEIDKRVIEVKSISFDYIRSGITNEDFRLISFTKDANVLCERSSWEAFVESHFNVVDEVSEPDVDETLATAVSESDTKQVLKQRDKNWASAVKKKMDENYNDAKDKIESKKQKEKPLSLLKKAISALAVVDLQTIADSAEKHDIEIKFSELQELVESIKKALK